MDEEYFIRTKDSEDNRGPFDMDQLATLAEAGKIDGDTLFYLEGEGEWKALRDVYELFDRLFPEEDKITLKLAQPKIQKVQVIPDAESDEEEEEEGVSVSEVLDSAEGRTKETEYLKRKDKEKSKAAGMSLPALGLSFLMFAFAVGWSNFDFLQGIVNEQNWEHLLTRPLVFVFAVDLILGLGLVLSASELFPLVRFRAMLGMGFFAYFFWSLQGYDYAWAVFAFGMGTMLSTLTLNLPSMIVGVLCLFGGSGYLAYSAFMGDLPQYFAF
ncbi:MAG: DUF4339 domain-containing protein [Opitutales bacterium]